MATTTTIRSGGPPAAAPARTGPQAAAWWASVVLGVLVVVNGAVLAVLAILAPEPLLARGLQVALSLAVLVPGLMILSSAFNRRRPFKVGLLAGELLLAGALIYLAVAMPAFHAAHVGYSTGLAQFVGVLVGLVLGCVALVVSGATIPLSVERGRLSLPAAIRDGVVLIVGTILVTIASGQFAMAQLTPPKWNWISFGAITVPGMLLLIARELVKQAYRRRYPDGRAPLSRLVLTETMLVVGLFVMIYGSGANLTLGANGYTTGLKGNPTGLAVLIAAVVFLVLVRGGVRWALGARGATIRWALAGNVAFAVGVLVFIYGERSVVMGKSPLPSFGAAFPAAVPFVVAGLLVLIVGRLAALTDAASAAPTPAPGGQVEPPSGGPPTEGPPTGGPPTGGPRTVTTSARSAPPTGAGAGTRIDGPGR